MTRLKGRTESCICISSLENYKALTPFLQKLSF